ncbi:hypothetical protein APASM_0192 [Actinosynnema pretiosum subsp. pretiosum]|nr:hypothetical protein APASM_0192 [Actinosynnema pretiosum subsp. pretiosum]
MHRHGRAALRVPRGLALGGRAGGRADAAGAGAVRVGRDGAHGLWCSWRRFGRTTGGNARTRDGGPVWSDPVTAAKQEVALHAHQVNHNPQTGARGSPDGGISPHRVSPERGSGISRPCPDGVPPLVRAAGATPLPG